MLLVFTGAEGLDGEAFSGVYRGSALENCRGMYPQEPDGDRALARYEADHLAYMAGPFWEEGGVLLVLAGEDGRYLAAVRLYPGTGEGCWQMEALETRPGERRKGYGLELLRQTQGWLERAGGGDAALPRGQGQPGLSSHPRGGGFLPGPGGVGAAGRRPYPRPVYHGLQHPGRARPPVREHGPPLMVQRRAFCVQPAGSTGGRGGGFSGHSRGKTNAPDRQVRGGVLVWGTAQASLALASSVSWVKAALSLMASSESILRLISTLASFRPCMKVE